MSSIVRARARATSFVFAAGAVAALALAATPLAHARSAIVIVVENNEKSDTDLATENPLLLELAAIPTERLLARWLTRELDRVPPLPAAEPAPRGERPSTAPRAPREARPAPAAPRNILPARLRALIEENGDRLLHDVLEPGIDRYGEAYYAKLLELAAARHWDRVVVLSDQAATFDRFKASLVELHDAGYTIDVVLNIHGSSSFTELDNSTGRGPDRLWFTGRGATPDDIRALGAERPLRLNAVYSNACWGSRFNEAWIQAGAKAANGARELNYYVLLSPLTFIYGFAAGHDLAEASRRAYEIERKLLDRQVIDEALAPVYGARGADRVRTAASSGRVHGGAATRAACRPEESAP